MRNLKNNFCKLNKYFIKLYVSHSGPTPFPIFQAVTLFSAHKCLGPSWQKTDSEIGTNNNRKAQELKNFAVCPIQECYHFFLTYKFSNGLFMSIIKILLIKYNSKVSVTLQNKKTCL